MMLVTSISFLSSECHRSHPTNDLHTLMFTGLSFFLMLQAAAPEADTSPVCSQTAEDQSGQSLRRHRHAATRRSTQTVLPENPAAS